MPKRREPMSFGRPVAFYRIFVDVAGSVDGAVFLSQLVYWDSKLTGDREWLWKSDREWFEEIGVKRHSLDTARKNLIALGIIETKVKGLPARHFYKLNSIALNDKIEAIVGARNKKDASSLQETANCPKKPHKTAIDSKKASKTRVIDNKHQDCRKQQTGDCGNQQTSRSIPASLVLIPETSLLKTANYFIDYSRDYNRDYSSPPHPVYPEKIIPMSLTWSPATSIIERLDNSSVDITGLDSSRRMEILSEFRSFWQANGTCITESQWQHKLIKNLESLKNKSQLYKKNINPRSRSIQEELNDKSWAVRP